MRQGRAKASRERSVERGFPLPSRRRQGPGERCKLPMQRGPGQSPGRKQFSEHLKLENVTSGDVKCHFCGTCLVIFRTG